MPIKVRCQCGQTVTVQDEAAGKRVKCPQCAKILAIPKPDGATHAAAQKTTEGTIAVACRCGKKLAVPKKSAGKRVKCPQCGQPITIDGASAGAVPTVSASKPLPTGEPGVLGDLLDDYGVPETVPGENACPQCRHEMSADDVVCVNCGYSRSLGRKIKTKREIAPEDDVSLPESMRKAIRVVRHEKTERRDEDSGPMTSWMLGLALFAGTAVLVGGALYLVKSSPETVEGADDGGGNVRLAIAGNVLFGLAVLVVWLLIASAILCGAVAIAKMIFGKSLPDLGFGKSMGIVVVTYVVDIPVGFLIGLMAAGGGETVAQIAVAQIASFPVVLLVMTGMVSLMLPTSIGRAALVTLFYFLILLAICLVIGMVVGVIIVTMRSMSGV